MTPATTPTNPEGTRLDGTRALVTGGARGIGAAIADALAAAGADIVLSGRSAGDLDVAAVGLAQRHGVRVWSVAADLSLPDGAERLAEEAWECAGALEVLVNNAGLAHTQPLVDTDAGLWDEVMTVNLRAPALLSARVGARMGRAGGGSIVNIASAAGLRALKDHYSYCVSKAGLVMATKMLALELGPLDVRANVVCPTVVMTDMGRQAWSDEEKSGPMLARIPLGRFADPEDVARAVVFLAGPGSRMINGAEVPVDGGFVVS